ncbi:MAG: RNA pseudouridine synthase [Bacteroidota bacterium]
MKKLTEDWSIGDLVLYKNNQLIAFNKPAGITVQADKSKDKSLLDFAEIYTKSGIHLIHRIDRPASGLVLFAKTKSALASMNRQFQERSVEKTYLAVVPNLPKPTEGQLRHYLHKNGRNNKSYAVDANHKAAKEAILEYKVLASIDNYHLLEIKLLTGRHHQIRAQLAAVSNPIKGDVKYGAKRNNKDRSIHLHSWKLSFTHPTSEERVKLTADLPKDPVWEAFRDML